MKNITPYNLIRIRIDTADFIVIIQSFRILNTKFIDLSFAGRQVHLPSFCIKIIADGERTQVLTG